MIDTSFWHLVHENFFFFGWPEKEFAFSVQKPILKVAAKLLDPETWASDRGN